MKITIVGSGYVGLVTGACLSEVGHHISCVDKDETKIEKLKLGVCPIFEPGLPAMLQRNTEHERLDFTSDLGNALTGSDCAFIAVGTPQDENGSADLKYVRAVAQEIGRTLSGDLLVVVKSTVPVGTCDEVERILRDELSRRKSSYKVAVASNPEFLKEGSAIDDFMKPDRIIVGVDDDNSATTFQDIYRPFILDDPGKLLVMERRSSELSKYGANCMLATRISFMNELSRLCDAVGANVDDVRRGIGSDPRIGKKFLFPGPGFGGSCFPKDIQALRRTADDHGARMKVLDSACEANEDQKAHVSGRIRDYFGDLGGKVFAVWGLAFKPGTDDVRETAAITICKTLLDGGAKVVAHDPEARETFAQTFGEHDRLSYVGEAYDALDGADALILATEWIEYRRPNWDKVAEKMRTKTVFDFRNQYMAQSLIKRGFYYECIGRPDSRRLN